MKDKAFIIGAKVVTAKSGRNAGREIGLLMAAVPQSNTRGLDVRNIWTTKEVAGMVDVAGLYEVEYDQAAGFLGRAQTEVSAVRLISALPSSVKVA